MNGIKQILVDLDGTLLGNRALPLSIEFVARSLRTLSPVGGIRRAFRGLLAIGRELKNPEATEMNDERVVRRFGETMGLSPEESRQKLREGLLDIFPRLQRHFFPLPGAKEFLEWAKTRYPLVLATNPVWPPEIIEMRVRWAGIDPAIFRSVTHIRMMKASKPSAEYYRQILTMEGFDARQTLLVGNDDRMDLPATKVGIRVYIVDQKERAKPSIIVGTGDLGWRGNFEQLKALLENQG